MRRVIACALALFLVPVVSIACGGGANQLCADVCDCEGCSDKELEDCNEAADELEEDVAREECTAELDAMLSCWREQSECDNDDDYEIDFNDCDDEADDFIDCCDNDCDLDAFFG
jgi:hypothetical protein